MKNLILPYYAILSIFLVFVYSTDFSQSTLLVDFGADASSNSFGLAGWNTLIKSPNVSYSSAGPGGLLPNAGVEEFDDYQGVQGTARNFTLGERIVVTWYNTSATETYRMNARISFADPNAPNEDGADGNWYTMRSFEDYRYSYQDIGPGETKKTVFNLTDSGVHATTGSHSVVNVNVSFEWFDSDPKQYLLCDKIELYYDADIVAPNAPTGLSASAVSDSKIELNWTAPSDNVGVVEYLVYLNGNVEGYSRTNSYTASLLEPATEYTFTVTALDAAGNESGHSASASATTNAYAGAADLFNPKGLEYKGAFTVPETFAYGGDAFEYNPDGDGGQAGAGAADGYPGSLYISNLNIPSRGLIAEVAIPAPVVSASHDINDLNEATVIQAATNIRPANVNNWDYVDIWRSGLEYVSEENRLYSSWGIYYTVTDEKHSSISFCTADNLSGSTKYGAWYIGASDALPNDKMLGDYLFRTPQSWADANTSGRSLVNGRYREGGLSGLGPTLYSFALLGVGEPPAADAVLPFTTLLEYGDVAASDNYNFPNSITDYNHSDLWRDADWISGGSTDAVMIIGDKAHGDNWYGYQGEHMRHNWVICDLPYPDFYATDPNGKGWQAHDYIPMAIFYDPDDLAAVAVGTMNSYDPQPYAAKRFDESIFWRDGKLMEIVSASYDDVNERLYVTEFNGLNDGRLIIHVFDYDSALVSVAQNEIKPSRFKLYQNYPNPFNPSTTIKYALPKPGFAILKVFDILGREVATLVNQKQSAGNYSVKFNAGNLPSGIYFYRIHAGVFTKTKEMMILK